MPLHILHIIVLLTVNSFTYQQYPSNQRLLFMVHTNVSFANVSLHTNVYNVCFQINVSPHISFLDTETEYALGTRAGKWHNRTSDHREHHMITEDRHTLRKWITQGERPYSKIRKGCGITQGKRAYFKIWERGGSHKERDYNV